MRGNDRIEPWMETTRSYSNGPLKVETKGTLLVNEGHVLRSKGEYSTDRARALLRVYRYHMVAEGYK